MSTSIHQAYAAASITLSPNSGLVGTTVTISGSGFSALDGTSTVTYDGVTVITGGTCNQSLGSISGCTFSVPASTAGAHTVQVTAGSDIPTATFTVSPTILDAAVPTSGPVGTTVSINFNNLIPNHSDTIKFGTTSISNSTVTTNSTG
ncbi:MAG: IPT/TIG domain-containing protein, partial [Thaumarchaeota archaeon]|nr:IPT/TIG domain-containing protein [Nitrososphaerota archaeon]